MFKNLLLSGCTLLAFAGAAQATVVATANLYMPTSMSGTLTTLDIQSTTAPSNATLTGSGYTVTFATASNQGVVRGASSGAYAIPVAGMQNGQATYLTGNYGSAQTTNVGASGNYFSTGTGSITVAFNAVQSAIALLWGSIDGYNSISFLDAAGNTLDTLTGSQVQSLASGFAGNGYQGAGGSAYVTATESAGFSAVRFNSTSPSFEFAGVASSTGAFYVPEPISMSLFGSGLALAGLVRLRRRQSAA